MEQTTTIDLENIQTITEQLCIAIFFANNSANKKSDWIVFAFKSSQATSTRRHFNQQQRMKRFVCTQTLCVFYFYWARLRILAWIGRILFVFHMFFFLNIIFIQTKWNGAVCMCSIIYGYCETLSHFLQQFQCKTQRKIFIRIEINADTENTEICPCK